MHRFTPPHSPTHHQARWPVAKRPRERTPFSRRPDLEILSVVIDAELIDRDRGGDPPSPELLLAGLLTHEFIRLLRYSDAGPPAHLPRHSDALSSKAVPGWIVVTSHKTPSEGYGVLAADANSVLQTGIIGNATSLAAQDTNASAYSELSADAAAKRRRLDAIAAQAAEAVGADMLITERPYLHTTQWEIANGLLIATPRQALPLVSLYLRAQDVFIGWRDPSGRSTTTLTRGSFYSTAAVELVPNAWPALNALAEHGQGGGDRRPSELLRAVLGRLQQALVARDSMYSALNRPQDNDAADETLNAFDVALLTLMGAVDASARIADQLLGLNRGEHAAGWNAKDWRKRAREASSEIDAIFSDGRHQHTLTILAELRNTIHGSQLGPLAVASQKKQIRTLIELPPDVATKLLSAINNRGGHERWGVTTPIRGRVHADPARLLDALLSDITAMLDCVIGAMPVSSLAGVNPANAPLPRTRLWVFGDIPRESILWQLAL